MASFDNQHKVFTMYIFPRFLGLCSLNFWPTFHMIKNRWELVYMNNRIISIYWYVEINSINLTYRMIKVMKMKLKRRLRPNREMKTYKTDLSLWSHDLLESSNGFTENQKKNIQNYNFENLREQIFSFIIKNFMPYWISNVYY